MSICREKKDIYRHLPRAFYLFDIETDLEAIQFSCLLDIIKALIAQLLNNKNEMSAVDV